MKSVCEQKNGGVQKRDGDEVVLIVFEFYCWWCWIEETRFQDTTEKKIMIFVALLKVW